MTTDPWDPGQYGRFGRERTQPFLDLLALVRPRAGLRVLDLGCGTGELTRQLHDTLHAAHTLGVDRSAAMLAESSRHATDGLEFRQADIHDVAGAGAYDLVFSNAALHWLPGHPELFGRLTTLLAEGGQLAVQVPSMEDHPYARAAVEVASRPPFRDELRGRVTPLEALPPEEYAGLLDRLGYAEQRVSLVVYGHRLPSREAVVEWARGTRLTAYQKLLSSALFEQFVEEYRRTLVPQLEDRRPFFFPFKRVLLWAGR